MEVVAHGARHCAAAGRATLCVLCALAALAVMLTTTAQAADPSSGQTAAQTASAPPAASGLELAITAREHSDMLPLVRWGDDEVSDALRSRRGGRQLAYVEHEVRISHGSASLGRFSLLARQSATLIASPGAIELAADAGTVGRPAGDRDWQVHGRYLAFAGSGLGWQHGAALAPGWRLQGGVQALALRHWRDRLIEGTASYVAANAAYRASLSSFEASDRLLFPYQQPSAGHGQALLFDAELHWTGPRFSAGLGLRDAGWLRWKGLPQNLSQLDTDTRTIDASGFVVYQPLVRGQNAQSVRQRAAPLRVLAVVAWQAGASTRVEASVEGLRHFGWLPRIGVEQALGDWRLGAHWHLHERRVTAGLGWRGLQLRVGVDRPGAQMRSRELALSGSWPL